MSLGDVGALLKQTRESKKRKLKDAAKALKIRLRYLEALEEGNLAEISGEIYLIGYLKSYAHWLGLDSEAIIADLKAQNDNGSAIGKKLPVTVSFFSPATDNIVKPGGAVLLLSAILTFAVYFFWYKGPLQSSETADYVPIPQDEAVITDRTQPVDTVQTAQQPNDYNFVLLAQDNVSFTLLNNEGQEISTHTMHTGDTFFVSENKGTTIKTDTPTAIEVFADDGANTFLGTLKPVTTLDYLNQQVETLTSLP